MKFTKYLVVAIALAFFVACTHNEETTVIAPSANCDCGYDTLETSNGNVEIKSVMSFETSKSDFLVVFDANFDNSKFGFDSTAYTLDTVNKVVNIVVYFGTSSANNGVKIAHKTIAKKFADYDYQIWVDIDGAMSKKGTRIRPIAEVNGTVPLLPVDSTIKAD